MMKGYDLLRSGTVFVMAAVFGLAFTAPAARAVEMYAGELEVAGDLAGTGGGGLNPDDFQISENFVGPDGTPGPALDQIFPAPAAPPGGFAYSFVQFSDVQLRDRNRPPLQGVLHQADPKVASCENDFYQDQLDAFYYGFTLKALRAAAISGRVQFLIHTGDSAHLSRPNEFQAFTVMTQDFLLKGSSDAPGGFGTSWLAAPIQNQGRAVSMFFNLAGNHDLFYIGNVPSGIIGRNLPPPNQVSGFTFSDQFINYYRLINLLQTVPPRAGQAPFGLNPETGEMGAFSIATPASARAYYSFDFAIPGHPQNQKARMIVLNTNETIDPKGELMGVGGYSGSLSPRQRDWLVGLLASSDADPAIDHVIVFGHQLLENLSATTPGHREKDQHGFLIELFAASPKVIAYLNGHDHQGHAFRDHDPDGRFKLLMYTAPAIMDSPKNFMVFTVSSDRTGRWELAPRLFNLEDLADAGALDTPDQNAAEVRDLARRESESLDPDSCLARGRRHCLGSLIENLGRMEMPMPKRMLFLAFLCLERADRDAWVNRENPEIEVRDQWTREEWRASVRDHFCQNAVIEKSPAK